MPLFARGISPIDDDEIATWKMPRTEKASMGMPSGETYSRSEAASTPIAAVATTTTAAAAAAGARDGAVTLPTHVKHTSTSSIKKPPSVIVYSNAHGQGRSSDDGSPRSFAHAAYAGGYGRTSLDRTLPQTPIQARAPNARPGLTDETVPGDDPFLPSPKRRPSRLSKLPPGFSSHRRAHHARARSSRSSTRSFGDYGYGYGYGGSGGSDVGLSPRHSHDYITSSHHDNSQHSRVYSSSSIPPRLSFGDEALISPRPLFREDEIGRAI
ncbi:hypothetical protein B0T17DRAFT_527425, partial [Bombardia bombarda]